MQKLRSFVAYQVIFVVLTLWFGMWAYSLFRKYNFRGASEHICATDRIRFLILALAYVNLAGIVPFIILILVSLLLHFKGDSSFFRVYYTTEVTMFSFVRSALYAIPFGLALPLSTALWMSQCENYHVFYEEASRFLMAYWIIGLGVGMVCSTLSSYSAFSNIDNAEYSNKVASKMMFDVHDPRDKFE